MANKAVAFKKMVGSGKAGMMSSPKSLFTGKPGAKTAPKQMGKGGCGK